MNRKVTPGRRPWVYQDNAARTLDELALKAGVAELLLSDMEKDKRGIGLRTAKKLGAALTCDYRRYL